MKTVQSKLITETEDVFTPNRGKILPTEQPSYFEVCFLTFNWKETLGSKRPINRKSYHVI